MGRADHRRTVRVSMGSPWQRSAHYLALSPCGLYGGNRRLHGSSPMCFDEASRCRSEAGHGGTGTLKDAMNEALRDWVAHVTILFTSLVRQQVRIRPMMVRDFQSVIGIETRAQILEAEGRITKRLGRPHRRRVQSR